MNLLSDIITYIRRIIKSPSNAVITDSLIVDYINRFWLMDVSARVQLFDLKTTYQFQTTPGVDKYNMPLYSTQIELGNQNIAPFPVYQGFLGPVRVNGINIPFYTQQSAFYNVWPAYIQQQVQVATGDGTIGPYNFNLPFNPAIPGHIDITGIIAYGNSQGTYSEPPLVTSTQINANDQFIQSVPTTSVFPGVYIAATGDNGQNIVVSDSGQFLASSTGGDLYGLLMQPGNAPYGNLPLNQTSTPTPFYSQTQNVVNYNTGEVSNLYFRTAIPDGTPITAQSYYIEQGIPRSLLYYDNTMTVRPPPNTQYLVEIEAYLTPAAFLNTADAVPFAYMSEYIARGAARKILADTGDVEQFQFYEPLFKEQETLVWKRSQRQFTATRTDTIFSNSGNQNNYNQSSGGT